MSISSLHVWQSDNPNPNLNFPTVEPSDYRAAPIMDSIVRVSSAVMVGIMDVIRVHMARITVYSLRCDQRMNDVADVSIESMIKY